MQLELLRVRDRQDVLGVSELIGGEVVERDALRELERLHARDDGHAVLLGEHGHDGGSGTRVQGAVRVQCRGAQKNEVRTRNRRRRKREKGIRARHAGGGEGRKKCAACLSALSTRPVSWKDSPSCRGLESTTTTLKLSPLACISAQASSSARSTTLLRANTTMVSSSRTFSFALSAMTWPAISIRSEMYPSIALTRYSFWAASFSRFSASGFSPSLVISLLNQRIALPTPTPFGRHVSRYAIMGEMCVERSFQNTAVSGQA